MKTIKMYSANAQSSDGGATKGSSGNPYTQEEYESMLDAGTWPGGYVQGMGYVLPCVEVWGSSSGSSDYDSDSWSDPWGDASDPWGDTEEDKPTGPTGGGGGSNNNNSGGQGGGNSSGGNGGGGTYNPYPQTAKTISGTAFLYQLVEGVGLQATFQYQCGVRISGYMMSIGVNVFPSNFTNRNFWATAVVKSDGGGEKYYQLSYSNQGYIYNQGWTVIGDVAFQLPKSGNVTVEVRIGFNNDTGVGHTSKSYNVHIYPF